MYEIKRGGGRAGAELTLQVFDIIIKFLLMKILPNIIPHAF